MDGRQPLDQRRRRPPMPPASARNRGTRTSGIAGSPPWPASPPRGGRPAGKPPVSRVSQDRGMRPKEARYHRGGVGDAFSRIRQEHGSVEPPLSGEGGHERGSQTSKGEPLLTRRVHSARPRLLP